MQREDGAIPGGLVALAAESFQDGQVAPLGSLIGCHRQGGVCDREKLTLCHALQGFWGVGSKFQQYNPSYSSGALWSSQTGQDFDTQFLSSNLFASFHYWPDLWVSHRIPTPSVMPAPCQI